LVDSLPSRGVISKLEVRVLVMPLSFAFARLIEEESVVQSFWSIHDAVIYVRLIDQLLVRICHSSDLNLIPVSIVLLLLS
jgi:hypothetical protein